MVLADMAPGPSMEELDKAPKWPSRFEGDAMSCKKHEKEFVESKLNRGETNADFMFHLSSQYDFNQDGKCEVVGYESYACGTGGCGYSIYHYAEGKFKYIGGWLGYEPIFLEPYNGWLQYESWSKGGMCCRTRALSRFVDGEYKTVRIDDFETDQEKFKMVYKGTINK